MTAEDNCCTVFQVEGACCHASMTLPWDATVSVAYSRMYPCGRHSSVHAHPCCPAQSLLLCKGSPEAGVTDPAYPLVVRWPSWGFLVNNLGCSLQCEHSQDSSHQSIYNLQITQNLCVERSLALMLMWHDQCQLDSVLSAPALPFHKCFSAGLAASCK